MAARNNGRISSLPLGRLWFTRSQVQQLTRCESQWPATQGSAHAYTDINFPSLFQSRSRHPFEIVIFRFCHCCPSPFGAPCNWTPRNQGSRHQAVDPVRNVMHTSLPSLHGGHGAASSLRCPLNLLRASRTLTCVKPRYMYKPCRSGVQ
jgi:hypothetical protein